MPTTSKRSEEESKEEVEEKSVMTKIPKSSEFVRASTGSWVCPICDSGYSVSIKLFDPKFERSLFGGELDPFLTRPIGKARLNCSTCNLELIVPTFPSVDKAVDVYGAFIDAVSELPAFKEAMEDLEIGGLMKELSFEEACKEVGGIWDEITRKCKFRVPEKVSSVSEEELKKFRKRLSDIRKGIERKKS